MAVLKVDGRIVETGVDITIPLDAYKSMYPDAQDVELVHDAVDKRNLTQDAIAAKYGNGNKARASMSLLGTIADAAQVLVLFACADAVALVGAADFAAYKKSRMDALTALSGSEDAAADIVQQAGQLLADVQSGAVLMPFLVKPDRVTGVFRDVAERAAGVAQALAQPETVPA